MQYPYCNYSFDIVKYIPEDKGYYTKITSLTIQEKDKNRCNLFLDGEFFSGISVENAYKKFIDSNLDTDKEYLYAMDFDGDGNMFAQFLEQRFGKKTRFLVPQRGRNAKLVQLSVKNAQEEAERASDKDQHINKTLLLLSNMLGIVLPNRIESYDISNISGTDIVASMIVFENGKPCKRDYKQFKLKNMEGQDDYASMRQVLERRFARYQSRDNGFHILPDLLLIDGGANHAKVAMDVLNNTGLSVPVFGMVKDDRHRTRALVTADNSLIGIDSQQSIFALIGNIQEETHRFAIGYHKKLRSRRLRYSELDAISGIVETRKALLLKHFKSITAISNATLSELENLLPKDAAYSVFAYFQNKKQGSE